MQMSGGVFWGNELLLLLLLVAVTDDVMLEHIVRTINNTPRDRRQGGLSSSCLCKFDGYTCIP